MIEPTRFVCRDMLERLGVHHDVDSMLLATQLYEFALISDVLYPNLVRQCLASSKLTHANPWNPTVAEVTFSFFAGGKRYSIGIPKFCLVYGFNYDNKDLLLPKRFPPASDFWNIIADGKYKSRSANQSIICSPALRLCAKIYSNILFAKEGTAKVKADELLLLYYGVSDLFTGADDLRFPPAPTVL